MKLRTVITTATTAAVLATSGVALAGAATTPTSPTSPTSSASAATSTDAPKASKPATAHRRARRHRVRAFVRKVVLETIGIDREALRRDLRSGKTIAEIASANGVDPNAVVDALVTAATAKLEAAASAGRITTDRAHRIEARLPARFTKLVDTWHPRRIRNAAPEARQ